jgi:hypothetical protein
VENSPSLSVGLSFALAFRGCGDIESRQEFSTARRSLWEIASLLTLHTF